MQTDATSSVAAQTRAGSVVALWRYPVKSMMGEELNSSEVTDRGLLGDRQFAVVDSATGKVGGAKNPRKWGNFFDFRAAYAEAPKLGGRISPIRITLPDGEVVSNDRADLEQILSHAFGREIAFVAARTAGMTSGVAEEYWPDMAGLEYRDTVTDFELPAGTFFDSAVMHLLTTSTIDRLRELYPQGRIEARRFRPNIAVSTGSEDPGFVENDWIGRTVVIGATVRLAITEQCPRCVMITLPQGDYPKTQESYARPLNTME
jgi:MOSC domain-containing protein